MHNEDQGQNVSSVCEPTGQFELPVFFDAEVVRVLVQHVYEAARDERERRMFASILRRAREDLLELEVLYKELPGVFAGDHLATENFRRVLNDANWQSIPVEPSPLGSWTGGGFIPNPDFNPCDPPLVVRRSRIRLLSLAVAHVARGNTRLREQYVNTLWGLWAKARLLERLHRHALHSGGEGRSRVAEDLRAIARDIESMWPVPDQFTPGPESPDFPPAGPRLPSPEDGPFPWPGPDDGPPIPWPPGGSKPGGGPGLPPGGIPPGGIPPGGRPPGSSFDPCNFFDDPCNHFALNPAPLPESARSDNVLSVLPATACPGEQVTVTGHSFGASKPADISLLVGDQVIADTDIVLWSDTRIIFRVPPGGLHSGCVGTRSASLEAARQSAFGKLNAQQGVVSACLGLDPVVLPYVPGTPDCTSANFFAGSVPVIEVFEVNGTTEWVAAPGETVTLAWKVRNAARIQIRRTSTNGPPLNLSESSSAPTMTASFNGSRSLDPFSGSKPIDAEYEITATNRCNVAAPVRKSVVVRLRSKPNVKILGMEVTQAIQHFDLNSPAQNNNTRLASGKKTMVRVYVESGLSDGFAYGDDPNTFPITGTLRLWSASGGPFLVTPSSRDPSKAFMARPKADIKRDNIFHTLNFVLPWNNVQGSIFMEVEVSPGKTITGLAQGVYAKATTSVSAQARRPLKLAVIFIRYQNTSVKQKAMDLLEVMRDMYPVAENNIIITQWANHETTQNLATKEGMEQLLSDVGELTEDLTHDYDAFLGILPQGMQYYRNGIGSADIAWPPGGISVENSGVSAAHEIGHALGFQHANCPPAGMAGAPEDIDMTLEPRTTEEGVSVQNLQAVPRNTGTLMSYCDGASRWVGVDLWDRLFNKLA